MTIALWQRPLHRLVQGIVRNNNGLWLDPSDMSTMFQDAAGTTPVTALEQPVGLWLDKSQGLELGPELITNGDFSNGAAGWISSNSTISSVGGNLRVVQTSTGAGASAYQQIAVTAGKTYKLSIGSISLISGGPGSTVATLRSDSNAGIGTTYISISAGVGYYTATTTTTVYLHCRVFSSVAVITADFDDVSLRELKGNHATQSITASRPTLSARYNLLTKTEDLTSSDWKKSNDKNPASSVAQNFAISPNGTLDAVLFTPGVSGNTVGVSSATSNRLFQEFGITQTARYTNSIYVKTHQQHTQFGIYVVNNITDTIRASTVITTSEEWTRVDVSSDGVGCRFLVSTSYPVLIWHPQCVYGSTPLPYQRVNTATDYDTDERYFPKYLRFDGIDDYMNLPYMGLYANGSASVVMAKSADYQTDSPTFLVETSSISTAPTYQLLGGIIQPYGLGVYIRNNAGTTNVNTKAVLAMDAQSTAHIVTIIDSGALIKRFNNSSIADSDAYTRSNPLTVDRTVIGAFYSGASIYNKAVMNLYGLIITKSALTDAQRVRCERYAASKAGVIL